MAGVWCCSDPLFFTPPVSIVSYVVEYCMIGSDGIVWWGGGAHHTNSGRMMTLSIQGDNQIQRQFRWRILICSRIGNNFLIHLRYCWQNLPMIWHSKKSWLIFFAYHPGYFPRKRYKGEFLIISARLSHQLTSLLQEFILRTSCQMPNAIHRRHTSLEGNGCIACPSTYICMDWDPRRSVQSCSEKLCCLPRVS